MKRDMDLVRAILLRVEAENADVDDFIEGLEIEGHTQKEVTHHVWLLGQGGFLEVESWSSDDGFVCEPRCLTWSGHEFLDTIRDPEVWSKTKQGARSVGGAGIELVWEIAKAYAKAKAGEALGVVL